MAKRTNIVQENLMGEVLLPVANEIPDITDEGYVFDRIQRTIATIPVKTPITRSTETEAPVGSTTTAAGVLTGPRPEGRPLTVEEAAVVQRRIRTISSKADQIAKDTEEVVTGLKLQLKDYDFQVDVSNKPVVKKAIKKLFGKANKYIDKAMYLEAVKRFNKIQQDKLDKEVDLGEEG